MHGVNRVIREFGGVTELARALGHRNSTTVHGWKVRSRIPEKHHAGILRAARDRGLDISKAEFERFLATPDETATSVGSQIRLLRKAAGITLQEMSALTGRSVGLLSRIERDAGQPSITTLKAIAQALHVNIGWFFDDGIQANRKAAQYIVRRDGRRQLAFSKGRQEGYVDYLLSPNLQGNLVMGLTRMPAHYGLGEPTLLGSDMVCYLLEGELQLHVDGEILQVDPGDSFGIRAGKIYQLSNPGDHDVKLVWALSPIRIDLKGNAASPTSLRASARLRRRSG